MSSNQVHSMQVSGKLFQCEEGHVMGMVIRTASKKNKLFVLKPELQMESEEMQKLLDHGLKPEFVAVIREGEVTCNVCGRRRKFVPEMRK